MRADARWPTRDIAAAAGHAVRGPLRPGAATRRRAEAVEARHRARSRPRLDAGRQPGRGPHPAQPPHADRGDAAHQLLPADADGERTPYCRSSSTRPRSPDAAAPAAAVRDLRVLARASRACTCASARSPAAACAGRTAREDFRTEILGLVKAQMVKNAVIVPVGAKGGFVVKRLPDPAVDRDAWMAEGHGLLPDVHPRPARRHRQPRRRRRSCRRATSCATTATTPTSSSPPTRAPRPSPTSPTRSRLEYGLLARRRVRLRRLGRLRPQGHGHHRPRRVGVGQAPLPRAGRRHPGRGLHGRRRRRHVRATCSATGCCCPGTSGWSPRSTTATSSSTRTRTRSASFAERERLFAPAALLLGGLRRRR